MASQGVFISDVDHTLLGDPNGTQQFAKEFARYRPRFRLVYASGRFCKSVWQSIREHGLPAPDGVIGGVGTEIELGGRRLTDWPPADPGWDPVRVRSALDVHPDLEIQPAEFLSSHKISYTGRRLSLEALAGIDQRLQRSGLHCDLIYSSNRDLDVLPRGIDKGNAALRLAAEWNVAPSQLLVAGDSGNDLALFRVACRGIVVANACDELRRLAECPASTSSRPHVYLAQQPFAAGVVAGLQYFSGGEPPDHSDCNESGSTCKSWQALR